MIRDQRGLGNIIRISFCKCRRVVGVKRVMKWDVGDMRKEEQKKGERFVVFDIVTAGTGSPFVPHSS